MAKKSIIEREKKREILTNKYSKIRSDLKNKIKLEKSFEGKLAYYSQLQKLPRNSSLTRIV